MVVRSDQGRQVLVGGAGNSAGAQDLDGLFDGGQLVGAQLLAVLEVGPGIKKDGIIQLSHGPPCRSIKKCISMVFFT